MSTAEIIAIGTELTSGAKLDTNSQWLSRELSDRGIAVRFHTTVADDFDENVLAVQAAIGRADVVLLTGGLGPTRDDITRAVMAAAVGVDLVEDPAAVDHLKAFFEARGRSMPERNLLQAQKPRGADLLANPVGTAPGLARVCESASGPCLVAAMPGVPSEMKPMFLRHVVPRLPSSGTIARRIVNCYGIGESAAEQLLGELTERGRDPEIGITASAATISLRVLAAGASAEEAETKAAAAEDEVVRKLGKWVFGRDADDVEHSLVQTLAARGRTLATVEVGSGGELAMRLARVPGHEPVVRGSVLATLAMHDEVLLGSVPLGHEQPFSPERAMRLAAAVRDRTGADYGLAIVADPSVVTATPTPPDAAGYLACIGDESDERLADTLTLLGNPAIHQARLAKSAMNLLRLRLIDDAAE